MRNFTVSIVGGGFSGMLVAINLCRRATGPLTINLINKGAVPGRGVAYQPYSRSHLLNVMAGKMSAFQEEPDQFVDWAILHEDFRFLNKEFIRNTYLPRELYGQYLEQLWADEMAARRTDVEVNLINDTVVDMQIGENGGVKLERVGVLPSDAVVLATGNPLPSNPRIPNASFFNSDNYFRNPWSVSSVENIPDGKDILILGNGLTMVDTVLGLLEHKFAGRIYSLSHNGFAILPHRHNGLVYTNLVDELSQPYHLVNLVALFNKHVKLLRKLGLSAEPVVDSLRPYIQSIWMELSDAEKTVFMKRLRHLWGVARHRLPMHIHDLVLRLKLEGKLSIIAGTLKDLEETRAGVVATYAQARSHTHQHLLVGRVINCTGPETDITRFDDPLFKSLVKKGMIIPDNLKLGMMVNPADYRVLDASHQPQRNLFAIGNLIKGVLWESTAVPEIRVQAASIAAGIVKMTQQKVVTT